METLDGQRQISGGKQRNHTDCSRSSTCIYTWTEQQDVVQPSSDVNKDWADKDKEKEGPSIQGRGPGSDPQRRGQGQGLDPQGQELKIGP